MKIAGSAAPVAWAAGGAVVAVGLGCLARAAWRLPHGLPFPDALAILIVLLGLAGLVAGVCGRLARRAASRIPAMIVLGVALAAELWSGALSLGAGAAPAAVPITDPPARAPEIADVRFVQRPDVYLIGFLGASPGAVLKPALGLEEAALERALETAGFRSFADVFSEAIPTRNAWDMLLGMTRDAVAGIPERARGEQFSGNQASPLFALFRRNGYAITALTEDFKFGSARGAGIDRYFVNQAYSICRDRDVVDRSIRPFVFFGACLLRGSPLFPDLRRVAGPPAELLLEVIREDGPHGGPRLTVAHLKPPLHAPSAERLRASPAEVERFARRYDAASRAAAGHLVRILEAIRAQKRDFVLFVFGDQGVGVLQKLAGESGGRVGRALLIRDRFAVLAAVYPKEACAAQLDDGSRTTAALLRGIVTCLAGGQDPWPAGHEHRVFVDGVAMDPRTFAD
ncbi:MAG: hypothetical protein R3F21_20460 [Myxococcota bacterium]